MNGLFDHPLTHLSVLVSGPYDARSVYTVIHNYCQSFMRLWKLHNDALMMSFRYVSPLAFQWLAFIGDAETARWNQREKQSMERLW